ncbi:tetratricopeptide repeat related protein [Cyclospora cayetanensis]|uniref:Tetratricopeptide repeat related protein n=1 Tax=Cyclospora cayetanensis TaxID=88456 RepID=A0A1D3D6B2_9EIME|nr:tetratricopeptide repeat related protein [Cyclospora cayetanensis]
MATPIKLPDGSLTERIYWLLREQQYHKVVEALEDLMQRQSYLENPRTFHALLSLLGYCLYTMGAFEGARQVYSQLHQAFPTVVEYELYMAYCVLYSTACEPTAALTTTRQDQDISAADPLISLCIRSEARDSPERATSDEALLDSAALFRVGKFDGGLRIAAAAAHAKMWTPALAYNEALCAYKVNAANLRCALDISDNRLHAAKGHLDMLCSRKDEGLDCVTLHNQALTTSSSDPADSISRLECLLAESRCPPTTASNLLILYCKHNHPAAAAALLADTGDSVLGGLSDNEVEFLRSFILALMALAGAYCEEGKLSRAESLLRCYEELCKDDINWKINMGHLRFMQKDYIGCLQFYRHCKWEELDDKRSVQGWEAGVLANMLAANIILGHLDQAQELLNFLNGTGRPNGLEASTPFLWRNSIPYSSAVKLVIGTVYCSEKAYDYGIKTMIEGLLPMEKILNADSWAQCKACIAALLTDVTLGAFIMDDQLTRNIIIFLQQIEATACSCSCSQGMNVLVDEARAFLRVLLGLAEEGTPSTK